MVRHDTEAENLKARVVAGVDDDSDKARGERSVAEVGGPTEGVEGREVDAGFAVVEAAEAKRGLWDSILLRHVLNIG
jgi:hypothetical protein